MPGISNNQTSIFCLSSDNRNGKICYESNITVNQTPLNDCVNDHRALGRLSPLLNYTLILSPMPTNAAGETVIMAQVGTHWLERQCLFPVVLIESADIHSIQDVNTAEHFAISILVL